MTTRMTDRKLCGFDLNGWRDHVAKNWRTVPGEEEEFNTTEVVSCGPLTSVVRVGSGVREGWVGGPQADLAPHGRGGGWGPVGAEERRRYVRNMMEQQDGNLEPLFAAFQNYGSKASETVIAVESTDTSCIAARNLKTAATHAKVRRPVFLSRHLLAALYAVEQKSLKEGQRALIVSHSKTGFTAQTFQITANCNATGLIPVNIGDLVNIESEFGYETLVRKSRSHALGGENVSTRTSHLAMSKSVARTAFGLGPEPEMVKKANGDWELLEFPYKVPDQFLCATINIPLELGCEVVVLETQTEGSVRDEIHKRLHALTTCPVITLEASAVAQGALEAARRSSSGQPI